MRWRELRVLLFLPEPCANDRDLRDCTHIFSRRMRKRRRAVLLVQRIVYGRGRREL